MEKKDWTASPARRFLLALVSATFVAFFFLKSKSGTLTFGKWKTPAADHAVLISHTARWCVLDHSNTNYHLFNNHIAHAAPMLFHCWTYFYEHAAMDDCGLVLNDGLHLMEGWLSQLVDAMQCDVLYNVDVSSMMPNPLVAKEHNSGVPTVRNNVVDFHNKSYFAVDGAAGALRNRIAAPGNCSPNAIGFIQRETNRRVTNFAAIRKRLSAKMPAALFDTVFFEGTSLAAQVQWMACHDIIIAAHGNALTNTAFIRPGTIVMELFPPNYYLPGYYQPLIDQSAGIALAWPKRETKLAKDTVLNWDNRVALRSQDFAANADDVVAMIVSAAARTDALASNMLKL